MLVSMGACTVMLTGLYIFTYYGPGFDPARLAAQVISGIGFLGAGTIMTTSTKKIKGLTTAAGLWAAACIGIANGAGFYVVSCGGCVILLLVLGYVEAIEKKFNKHQKNMNISVVAQSTGVIKEISQAFETNNMSIYDVELNDRIDKEGVCFTAVVKMKQFRHHEEVLKEIMAIDGVVFVEEM